MLEVDSSEFLNLVIFVGIFFEKMRMKLVVGRWSRAQGLDMIPIRPFQEPISI